MLHHRIDGRPTATCTGTDAVHRRRVDQLESLLGSIRRLRHGYGARKEGEGSTSSHSEDSNGKGMSTNTRAAGNEYDEEIILTKLESDFEPTQNVLYERYLFHEAVQQPNELVDQYIIRSQRLAEMCNFKNAHDDMIRERLLIGCKDKAARARLFRQKECTLTNAFEAQQISEQTQEQLKQITIGQGNSVSVNAVQKGATKKHEKRKDKAYPGLAPCKYCDRKNMYLIEANVQQMAEIVIAIENPTTSKQFAGSEKTQRGAHTQQPQQLWKMLNYYPTQVNQCSR